MCLCPTREQNSYWFFGDIYIYIYTDIPPVATPLAVLEAVTKVAYMEKRKIRLTVNTKWPKNIQTQPRIYYYVAELSCCAKSKRNWLTKCCWEIGEFEFFFTRACTDRQILSSRLQTTKLIWKHLRHARFKTRSFTPRCTFWRSR